MFNRIYQNDIFREFERMNQLFANHAFKQFNVESNANLPALNIAQNDEQVSVYSFAPGLDADSIDITLDDHVLTLKASKTKHEAAENERAYQVERSQGDFERQVRLPKDINPEAVEASYDNGVLTITIARQAKPVAKKISVVTH